MYGSFVRSLRTARGLSQEDLAELSGVSQPNISAIENDRRRPSVDTLNRLAVACGFELAATAGERRVDLPLPRVGWFPDEGHPEAQADDPADEPSILPPDATPEQRAAIVSAVLDTASQIVTRR